MNMQEVREAIVRYNARQYAPRGSEWDSFYEPIQEHNDKEMIADAFTDPTPLTEELLFEKAKVVSQLYGHWALYFTGFHVVLATEGRQWKTSQLQPLHISPNTLGELTMLELLMEGR